MKIFTSLIICFITLIGVRAEIKIQNSGFEEWEPKKAPEKNTCKFTDGTNPKGWGVGDRVRSKDAKKTETCSPDDKIFHGGKLSCKISNSNPKKMLRVVRFCFAPITGGKFYRFSVWLKGQGIKPARGNNGIMLQFIPGSKKHYWSDKRYAIEIVPLKGDFDWKKVSVVFPVRSEEEMAGLAIGLQRATGTLWIDDVSLEEVTESEYIAQLKKNITSKVKPDVWRKPYGPHSRQKFTLFLPKSKKPAPVLVSIHGGGWLGGDGLRDADTGRLDGLVKYMNARGIAVAAINYRFSPLPDPVYDAARAIQYLRAHAKEYNLDKTRFAATGFSAGATTSLWLALHDDLADPKSKDPVLRESTRLKGAYILGVQSSIDPVTIRSWKIGDAIRHQMICRAAGFKSNKEMDAKYETKKDVYKEFSPITHASKDDPEVRISARSPLSNKRDWIHHPVFGYEFKKHADKVGALCDIELSDQDKKLVPPVKDRNGYEFLVRVLTK